MEKPEIWETLKKIIWTKITKRPEILNNFYILNSKILISHEKTTI